MRCSRSFPSRGAPGLLVESAELRRRNGVARLLLEDLSRRGRLRAPVSARVRLRSAARCLQPDDLQRRRSQAPPAAESSFTTSANPRVLAQTCELLERPEVRLVLGEQIAQRRPPRAPHRRAALGQPLAPRGAPRASPRGRPRACPRAERRHELALTARRPAERLDGPQDVEVLRVHSQRLARRPPRRPPRPRACRAASAPASPRAPRASPAGTPSPSRSARSSASHASRQPPFDRARAARAPRAPTRPTDPRPAPPRRRAAPARVLHLLLEHAGELEPRARFVAHAAARPRAARRASRGPRAAELAVNALQRLERLVEQSVVLEQRLERLAARIVVRLPLEREPERREPLRLLAELLDLELARRW